MLNLSEMAYLRQYFLQQCEQLIIMVGVAQLVEPRVVIPVVVGSSPIAHPRFNHSTLFAKVAELVDALDLGSSGVTCESSSLSFRTISINNCKR